MATFLGFIGAAEWIPGKDASAMEILYPFGVDIWLKRERYRRKQEGTWRIEGIRQWRRDYGR